MSSHPYRINLLLREDGPDGRRMLLNRRGSLVLSLLENQALLIKRLSNNEHIRFLIVPSFVLHLQILRFMNTIRLGSSLAVMHI